MPRVFAEIEVPDAPPQPFDTISHDRIKELLAAGGITYITPDSIDKYGTAALNLEGIAVTAIIRNSKRLDAIEKHLGISPPSDPE